MSQLGDNGGYLYQFSARADEKNGIFRIAIYEMA
jgi:hypothetical protein